MRPACRNLSRQATRSLRAPRPLSNACGSIPRAVATRMRYSTLQSVNPPVSTTHPADAFQLLPESQKVDAEDALFEEEVKQVEAWWATDRYKNISILWKSELVPTSVVDLLAALHQMQAPRKGCRTWPRLHRRSVALLKCRGCGKGPAKAWPDLFA